MHVQNAPSKADLPLDATGVSGRAQCSLLGN